MTRVKDSGVGGQRKAAPITVCTPPRLRSFTRAKTTLDKCRRARPRYPVFDTVVILATARRVLNILDNVTIIACGRRGK